VILTLIRKELLTNLLTLRLAVAVGFTVVLSVLTTFIGSLNYSQNLEAYQKEVRDVAEALDKASIYSQVEPRVVLPPQPLGILCRGLWGPIGQAVYIDVGTIHRSSWSLSSAFDSAFMKTLIQIDFTTVVALLLSFLAVALGFDRICGERESGTLKQLLTNPIPRAHVVLSKLLGGMISLWIPFALAFTISLLIILTNADVTLGGEDWVRLGIFFVLSCLFLAQIFAFSLMVSTFTRHPDTALIICLFAWLVGGIGYVNVLPSFSRYSTHEIPFQNYLDQQRVYFEEFDREMEEWDQNNPSPGEAYVRGLENGGQLRYAHPDGYVWLAKRTAVEMDKRLELADRRYKARYAVEDVLAQEAYVVDRWSILSPFINYQALSYVLARTTLDDAFYLGAAGQRYRETFISYLRGKNAFSSRRWFTDDPPDQEPMIANPQEVTPEMLAADSPFMRKRLAWAQEQEKAARRDDRRQLDLTDMPKFGGSWERSLSASLGEMMPGFVVLLLSFGATVTMTFMRFWGYDPQ